MDFYDVIISVIQVFVFVYVFLKLEKINKLEKMLEELNKKLRKYE